MRNMRRLAAIGVLSVVMVAGLGTTPGMAQPARTFTCSAG
jgi:hypothetical protein